MVAKMTMLLWAACLSFYLSVSLVQPSYIPLKMNKTIRSLLQHYSIPDKEWLNGNPVFSRELLLSKMEDGEKRVYMDSVLEVYEKVLGQMLAHLTSTSPAPTGASPDRPLEQLTYIQGQIRDLRRLHFQNHGDLRRHLVGLEEIQAGDRVVQSKALWELPWLYREASKLTERGSRRRRRRRWSQTQKAPRP